MSLANPTPLITLERQVDGTNANTWGDRYNSNFARIEAAVSGSVSIDTTAGTATLTAVDSGDLNADAQTRFQIITATGTPASAATIIWPAALASRLYYVINTTGQNVTFKVTGQTGVTVVPSDAQWVRMNGTDLVAAPLSFDNVRTDTSGNIFLGYNIVSGIYFGTTYPNPIASGVNGAVWSGGQIVANGASGGTTLAVGSTAGLNMSFYNNTTAVGSITTNGSTTAYNTTSDYRAKDVKYYYQGALKEIDRIPVYYGAYKAVPDEMRAMLLAHQVQAVAPYAVRGEKDGAEFQQLDHSALVPLLVAAIQELRAQVQALQG